MLIKASGITNLTDARYFAAREVHFLGFNLEEGTEGYLDPIYMKAIREWVEGPAITGEFSTSAAATVREAAVFYGLDAVQVRESVHGNELALFEELPLILELDRWNNLAELEALLSSYTGAVQHFLIDFSEKKEFQDKMGVEKGRWAALFSRFPVIIHLDTDPETFTEIVALTEPAGISLRGGEEEKVGVKSFDDVEKIFELLGIE